jgi:hypothetical protein
VDAGRLLVALLLAEADADVVAAFHHLPARLGEAGLVAVGRRQGEEARQEQRQQSSASARYGRRRAASRAAPSGGRSGPARGATCIGEAH